LSTVTVTVPVSTRRGSMLMSLSLRDTYAVLPLSTTVPTCSRSEVSVIAPSTEVSTVWSATTVLPGNRSS